MIGIYKITNPKGKIYIGQSVNVEKRLREYRGISNCKNQIKLYRSIIKYGFSEHIFEVLEECTVEELNIRERYWQDFYKVLEEGLNCRLTETKDKSGRMSEEIKQKHCIPILQYSAKGVLLKEWKSTKEAGEILNIIKESITRCLKGVSKSAGGFIWKYKTDKIQQHIPVFKIGREAISQHKNKAVFQYSKEGDLIKEWDSAKKAGETLNIQRNNITSCCRGEIKSAGGFFWEYKNK